MECKLRSDDFRRLTDHRQAFRPASGETWIADWYRSTIGAIEISMGTPRSAGENFWATWDLLGAPATSLEAPMTSLGAPGGADDMPWSPNHKSGNTVNYSRAVC